MIQRASTGTLKIDAKLFHRLRVLSNDTARLGTQRLRQSAQQLTSARRDVAFAMNSNGVQASSYRTENVALTAHSSPSGAF